MTKTNLVERLSQMEVRTVTATDTKTEMMTLTEAAQYVAKTAGMIGRPEACNTPTGCLFNFEYATVISIKGISAESLRLAYRQSVARPVTRVQVCDNCRTQTATAPARICGDCSEALAADFEAAAVADQPEATLNDGTYTLVYGNGEYFTFRIRIVKTGRLTGKRVVEYLSGPDNGLDFQAFAFVNEGTLNVWSRFERGPLVNRAREIEALARNDREGMETAGLRYAERSSRCRRCNKVLTVPASLTAGYGPDCAAIIGAMYGEATEPKGSVDAEPVNDTYRSTALPYIQNGSAFYRA